VKARGGGTVIARFRAEVLRLSGGRCEAVIDGVRCDVTDAQRLEAHHLRGVAAGGSNDAASNGVCLCKLHHAMIEARKLNVSD
jgi:predicted restriction endonuclease